MPDGDHIIAPDLQAACTSFCFLLAPSISVIAAFSNHRSFSACLAVYFTVYFIRRDPLYFSADVSAYVSASNVSGEFLILSCLRPLLPLPLSPLLLLALTSPDFFAASWLRPLDPSLTSLAL